MKREPCHQPGACIPCDRLREANAREETAARGRISAKRTSDDTIFIFMGPAKIPIDLLEASFLRDDLTTILTADHDVEDAKARLHDAAGDVDKDADELFGPPPLKRRPPMPPFDPNERGHVTDWTTRLCRKCAAVDKRMTRSDEPWGVCSASNQPLVARGAESLTADKPVDHDAVGETAHGTRNPQPVSPLVSGRPGFTHPGLGLPPFTNGEFDTSCDTRLFICDISGDLMFDRGPEQGASVYKSSYRGPPAWRCGGCGKAAAYMASGFLCCGEPACEPYVESQSVTRQRRVKP